MGILQGSEVPIAGVLDIDTKEEGSFYNGTHTKDPNSWKQSYLTPESEG